MPIDHFTREQFEAALPNNVSITHMGLVDGEFTYHLQVLCGSTIHGSYGVYIAIRSSVRTDGQSAGTGEDSIRLYLMSPTGPVASKLTKYVTRVKGWEQRMVKQLRTLYKIGLSLKPCPQCGALMHAFIAGKGKDSKCSLNNKGRLFQRCVERECVGKQNGIGSGWEWIQFKEDKT